MNDNIHLEHSPKELNKDSKNSRLLEFPTASRQSPDWRAELSERVRQVRERRNLQEARGRLQAELQAATQRYQQPATVATATALETKDPKLNSGALSPEANHSEAQHLNPIIEAALRRAQRASEVVGQRQSYYANSNLATAPKLTPSRANNPSANIALATARPAPETPSLALAPEAPPLAVVTPKTSGKIELLPDTKVSEPKLDNFSATNSSNTVIKPVNNNNLRLETTNEGVLGKFNALDRPASATSSLSLATEGRNPRSSGMVATAAAVALAVETAPEIVTVTDPATISVPNVMETLATPEKPVRVIKESDTGPDYLDELVMLCDQNLTADYPNYYQQIMAIAIDLAACLLASLPFWLVTYIFEADLQNSQILLTLCGITILLTVIYHTFTTFVLARTFGMMFVGTRVVNNDTTAAPSLLQSLVRGLGFVFSTLVVGLGFLWMFVDREHRALPDVVSNTMVVRDY